MRQWHHAYLITDGTEESRREKVEGMIRELKVEPTDILIIESENGAIKISASRELKRWIQLKPHSSPVKIAIIYGIEQLTAEAANALLKTLEEPPANSILILTAASRQGLLPTIISRCHYLRAAVGRSKNQAKDSSPSSIENMTLPERFKLAEQLAKEENLVALLAGWAVDWRQRLIDGQELNQAKRLKNLERSRRLLLTTNVDKRLLLENLMLII